MVIAAFPSLSIRKLLTSQDWHLNYRMAPVVPYSAALVRKEIAGRQLKLRARRKEAHYDTGKTDQSISWVREVIGR